MGSREGPRVSALGEILDDSHMALRLKPKMESITMIARSALAWTSAQLAFSGAEVDLPPYEELKLPEESVQSTRWAQTRWTEGLYRCAASNRLTPEAHAALVQARERQYRRHLANDIIQLTIDLQWWLLKEGRFLEAADESEWIRQSLEASTYDRAILGRWLTEVDSRLIHDLTLRTVFDEVRGVRNAAKPVY